MKTSRFKSILLALILLLLLPALAPAQTWYSANQRTVAWDPVTTDDAGVPLPAGSVNYKIFYKLVVVPEPVFISEIATNQVTITFPNEGSYFVGVSSVRKEGQTVVAESIPAWSDNPTYCEDGRTFGIRFYRFPGTPRNLHPVVSDVQIPLRLPKVG
jgi:hypothetical protein